MEIPQGLSSFDQLYRPLRSWQTRIIRLHPGNLGQQLSCDLLVADLIYFDGIAVHDGENVLHTPYDALSYVWGSPDLTTRLKCNGTELHITDSLSSALQHLRRDNQSRYLWVDAICIHQGDNEEKAAQVRNMMAIYRKAEKVAAWLGKEHQNLDDFFYLCREASSSKEVDSHMISKIQQRMQYLSELPYFHRVWVQQEAYVAKKLVFYSENGSIYLATIQRALTSCMYRPNSEGWVSFKSPGLFYLAPEQPQKHKAHSTVIGSEPSETKYAVDLLDALCIASTLHSSNPLDKVYAILGVTATPTTVAQPQDGHSQTRDDSQDVRPDRPAFPIDYNTSLERVHRLLTWYFIERDRDLNILVFASIIRMKSSSEHWLPSFGVDISLPVARDHGALIAFKALRFFKDTYHKGWRKWETLRDVRPLEHIEHSKTNLHPDMMDDSLAEEYRTYKKPLVTLQHDQILLKGIVVGTIVSLEHRALATLLRLRKCYWEYGNSSSCFLSTIVASMETNSGRLYRKIPD